MARTTTANRAKNLWFIEQNGKEIDCQPLNTNYVPSGPKRKITLDELIAKFSPEPEFYLNSVFPQDAGNAAQCGNGDTHRDKGETFAANVLMSIRAPSRLMRKNVRAKLLHRPHLSERGDNAKAEDIFQRLVNLDATFEPEHKHLFNEFSINLRKNKMLQESLEYYKRAMELSPNDENLYMNVARVLLELKDLPQCVDYLLKALELAPPRHETSLKFLAWLIQAAPGLPTVWKAYARHSRQRKTGLRQSPKPQAI